MTDNISTWTKTKLDRFVREAVRNAPFPSGTKSQKVTVTDKLTLDGDLELSTKAASTITGYEYSYTEFSTPVSSAATTSATAVSIVTSPAVTLDGKTTIWVDCYFPFIYNTTGLTSNVVVLYQDSTELGLLGRVDVGSDFANMGEGLKTARRLTPAAGTHTFTPKLYCTGGTATAHAGTGGTGGGGTAWFPGYIRIVKA